jgi:hypothetical protein
MHPPRYPALYSPRNFLLGCRVWLQERAAMTHAQAAGECSSKPGSPLAEGPRGALLALAAGVVFILVLTRFLGFVAPAAVHQAASYLTARMLVQALGLLGGLALAWLAWRAVAALVRGYAHMCRLGHAARLQQPR